MGAGADGVSVLFICLGNICRSPLAEAVFRDLVEQSGLAGRISVDSAGTGDYHVGERADPRTRQVASRRGITLSGRARVVVEEDLERFDYLVAMDDANRRAVLRLGTRSEPPDVLLLRAFDPESPSDRDVPDPYYGGPDGFERVHDIVERSCRRLLQHIRDAHGL